MINLRFWAGRPSALPPLAFEIAVQVEDAPDMIVAEPIDGAPQSIAGFICVIDYCGETRLITGRRYDLIGDLGYVGAICHTASGYRQFRCDRISAVSDAYTGEVLGDGGYFARFSIDGHRERAPSWGLTPGRKHLVVSGLNIMAFMARCDGYWHPLESGAIERFVCSLWLRKEWPGNPPIEEIIAHAQRLAPDSEVFFRSLARYAPSQANVKVIKRAVIDLIEADGVVCASETTWAQEVQAAFEETSASSSEEFIQMLRQDGVID